MIDSPEAVVELRRVTKRRGEIAAVKRLDLEIKAGEIFGLVGPDGAGKTTTLELVCGLLRPDSGELRVFGQRPDEAVELSQELGLVSQEFTLYGSLTVEENLDFFTRIQRVPESVGEERKRRLLHFARLEPFVHRRAEALSGGMKKKLALCCALVHEPRLLVLDEPTLGVDPVSRRELWEIVFGFLERGVTVLVSTPYMDEAEMCHRVGLLADGKLLAMGQPDVLRRLVEGELLSVRGRSRMEIEQLSARLDGFLESTSFGDRLHLRVRDRASFAERLRRLADERGLHLSEMRPIEPSLDDVFLALANTGRETKRHDSAVAPLPAQKPTHKDRCEVRIRGLTRRFGDFTAVDAIDLDVSSGEIFGFLGPNGSGKTTTIKMLCGLLPPTAGEIEIAGLDAVSALEALRPSLGYMSQHFSLYPDLTVVENLELFGGLYGVPRADLRERMAWVVSMAGLEGRERWLAGQLAGGFRQRLALGAALLHGPKILFLDEPTSGVDPASRKRFWQLIDSLAHRGTTVFVTTHYMDEAEHCHRLALLYEGEIIAEGSPDSLRREMRAGDLVELECDRPLEAVRLAKQESYVWEASLFGKSVHVLVDDCEADTARLVEKLSLSGLAVRGIAPIELSLEDLFVLFIAMHDQRVKESMNESSVA